MDFEKVKMDSRQEAQMQSMHFNCTLKRFIYVTNKLVTQIEMFKFKVANVL